jgi:hypothetical protein
VASNKRFRFVNTARIKAVVEEVGDGAARLNAAYFGFFVRSLL